MWSDGTVDTDDVMEGKGAEEDMGMDEVPVSWWAETETEAYSSRGTHASTQL